MVTNHSFRWDTGCSDESGSSCKPNKIIIIFNTKVCFSTVLRLINVTGLFSVTAHSKANTEMLNCCRLNKVWFQCLSFDYNLCVCLSLSHTQVNLTADDLQTLTAGITMVTQDGTTITVPAHQGIVSGRQQHVTMVTRDGKELQQVGVCSWDVHFDCRFPLCFCFILYVLPVRLESCK